MILGYVRTAVHLAHDRGDAINGTPYGAATLACVLGRPPTAWELQHAAAETLRTLAPLAGTPPASRAGIRRRVTSVEGL